MINKKMLPVKLHYFFFNAGTAPLVPYLSTYARQIGFSSSMVGLIYTILPIFGLIAKPLFGIFADRFNCQKSLFLFFQIVTMVTFGALFLVSNSAVNVDVELDCGNGITVLRSCYDSKESIDQCKVTSLGNTNGTALCHMNCDMTSPKMWQTVCEHWHIPQYCYSNTENIIYTSQVTNISMTREECAYIYVDKVILDGYTYNPQCRVGNGYVDINEPCTLNCVNKMWSSAIGSENAVMTCMNGSMGYRLCKNDKSLLTELAMKPQSSVCQASCDLDESTPWRLMEICEGWQADSADSCRPKTKVGDQFPSNLSFIGTTQLSTTIPEDKCVYIRLTHVELPDGSTHYPNCVSKAQYQLEAELFHSSCNITCNNSMLNDIFLSAFESKQEGNMINMNRFFKFFTLMMIINWVGQAVVVTFADTICFVLLEGNVAHYGKQRLWGSVGWGIFSLLTGVLIDVFSEDDTVKDYTVAVILMFIFMSGDVIVSCFIKTVNTTMTRNFFTNIGTLLTSLQIFIFMLWTIAVGLCTGLLWQFLFWHLEDISGFSCDGSSYIKTLQGLVSAIQTFCGEIPFMFVSGTILTKLGHVNVMSLVLFAFGIRFILYSFLTNPWLVLPIEMLQGVTFGMFYPTMTSYASIVSPLGTETTVQGLVGAIFEGVGVSLGSYIGGRLYEVYGGWKTFRWFGYGSLILCFVHIVIQYKLKDKISHNTKSIENVTPFIYVTEAESKNSSTL